MLSSPDELTGKLKAHGILPTQQRLSIARALFEQPAHVSADQVMQRVNVGGDYVSKATVYNTLGLFARSGLINAVIVDPMRVFYDPNTSPHHHFYNVDTSELMDIETGQLGINELPEPPEGTTAEGVDVIIRVRNKAVTN